MKKIVLVATLAMLCAGCEHHRVADDTTCRSYGLPRGTMAYAECRALQDMRRDRRREVLLNFGARMLENSRRPAAVPAVVVYR
jgi:hypothetical protein